MNWQAAATQGASHIAEILHLSPAHAYHSSMSSGSDAGNVCVIRRSLLEHPTQSPQSYLSGFVQEVGGGVKSSQYSCHRAAPGGVAALVHCPPCAVKDSRVRLHLDLASHGLEQAGGAAPAS